MMPSHRRALVLPLVALAACGGDSPPGPGRDSTPVQLTRIACGAGTIASYATNAPTTSSAPALSSAPATLAVLGGTRYGARYTAEVAVRGTTAYTTTWGSLPRGAQQLRGNLVLVWDVAGDAPRLVDSVVVAPSGLTNVGDVAISPDGRTLVVATEPGPLAMVTYDLSDPRRPRELARFSVAGSGGAHTAEIGVVGGRLHAFLALNPNRMSIVDLGDPSNPRQLYSVRFDQPGHATFMHDATYRDGLLFMSLWDEGTAICDVGGGGKGGTPTSPVEIARIPTNGGNAHNSWWFHDPSTGARRYLFVGEEQAGAVGTSSAGDVHVLDIADPAQAREVAFYRAPPVAGRPAGTHNFSVDEARGILYAAYYNGGVVALDVRGDLSACSAPQRGGPGDERCDLSRMGREIGRGLLDATTVAGMEAAYVWGVQYLDGVVYASDMMNGLWKLRAIAR
jgi:hypothetical protein